MAAKTISCTNCGAPLELTNPRAKTAVCASCGAQLDLTSPDYAFLGVVQRDPMRQPLTVGMSGTYHDQAVSIIGHIRFKEDDYWWDEYLLHLADGQSLWLQYDDGRFSMYRPKRLTERLDPTKCTGRFQLGGKWHYAREFGAATIDRIEGELTWKATVGDTVRWIDASDVGIEWTDKEIEVFDVDHINRGFVARTFGIDRAQLDAGCYSFDDDEEEQSFGGGSDKVTLTAGKLLIIGIVLVLFIAFAYCTPSSGYHNTGYHRGYHGGGGFHFGK